MRNEPLVSVMIPTYNRAHLLPRALKTVVAQTYENLEILIYDDGSTDNTEEIIRVIADPRIRYIKGEKNQGECPSRNILLDAAKGEYGCWLDTDDMCNIHRVEWQLKSLRAYAPSFIRCAVQHMSQVPPKAWKGKPARTIRRRLVTPSAMFRMDHMREVGYRTEGIVFGCDIIAELEMVLRFGPALYLPFVLYYRDMKAQDRLSATYHKKRADYDSIMEAQIEMKRVLLAALAERGIKRQLEWVPEAFLKMCGWSEGDKNDK